MPKFLCMISRSREYTARMRAVDLNKCLPFDDGGEERSEAAASLPPISVRKFRWWSDELAVAGEENSRGQITGFHDDSEMDMIVEGEEMNLRSLAKEKQRTPKKQSIVELFAVAPQIETVDDDDDDDERAEENRDARDEGHEQELGVEDLGCSDLVALASRMKKSKKHIRINNKKEMMRRKIQMKYKNKKKRISSAKKIYSIIIFGDFLGRQRQSTRVSSYLFGEFLTGLSQRLLNYLVNFPL